MSRIGPWLGALGRVVRGGPAHQVRRIRLGPAGTPPAAVDGSGLPIATPAAAAESADARLEVVGSPHSLLSVSLSASQNLYTRRGTLVGLAGKAENVISTLRVLQPLRRAFLGMPFLYQKISSTSPVNALIAARSPITSFAVVRLDGTVDWTVAQKDALLAWTGHSLRVLPKANTNLNIAHWGHTDAIGRGLLALAGRGQVYTLKLHAGEHYVAHPSHVLAYTTTAALASSRSAARASRPRPYRFKSSALTFKIPSAAPVLGRWASRWPFLRAMAESDTWLAVRQLVFALRTWSRRTIWGDRLFLQFEGPATILLQSRAATVTETLSTRQVNEIADATPGEVREAVETVAEPEPADTKPTPAESEADKREHVVRQSVAHVQDGKVEIGPRQGR